MLKRFGETAVMGGEARYEFCPWLYLNPSSLRRQESEKELTLYPKTAWQGNSTGTEPKPSIPVCIKKPGKS